MLEMTGERHPLSVTCLWVEQIDHRAPSPRAAPHCEKAGRQGAVTAYATRGQVGPLVIPEITSYWTQNEVKR